MFTRIAVAVLLIASVAFSQPKTGIEFGRSTLHNIYFVDVDLSYKYRLPFKNIDIYGTTYGNILTWQKLKLLAFEPHLNTYRIGQMFICRGVFIKFEHYCTHPVISNYYDIVDYAGNILYKAIDPSPYWWRGSQETISIGYEHTFK